MEYVLGIFLLSVLVGGTFHLLDDMREISYRDNKKTAKTLRIKRKF